LLRARLRLPDMSGFDVLERIARAHLREHPIVVFTGKDLRRKRRANCAPSPEHRAEDVQSPSGLLDETALFLHALFPAARGNRNAAAP